MSNSGGLTRKMKLVRRAALLLATACIAWPVQAESTLEEVVVTAQRREEKAQDVPVAISAFSANDLDRLGIRQAGDITAAVPNLVLSSPYGAEAQPTLALRGVTTNDFSQNQGSPVAMYVDEVYKPVGALQALQTFDLERVEVLRGPQGTLYGKNATGGAVSFFSRNPRLDGYDGDVTVGVGNYSAHSIKGAVGGPISDGVLGWRVAAFYEKRDGWMDSIVPGVRPLNGVDSLAGRLSLLAKPRDDFSLLLKVSASRSRGTPFGARPINVDPTITGSNPSLGWFQNSALYAVDKVIDNDGASLKADWQINDHYTLTSVTAYDFGRWEEISDDASVGTAIYGPDTYASTVNSFSQELRIASRDTGKFTWLAGAYYGRDSVRPWTLYHFYDTTQGLWSGAPTLYGFDQYNTFSQIRESKAVFLNATFALTPTVTVRGGLRYTRDTMSIRNFYALNGGLPAFPTPGPDQPVQWTQSIPYLPTSSFIDFTPGLNPRSATYPALVNRNSNVSFKVGIDWKPTDDVLLYGSVSQGYRGAAFNAQAFNDPAELTFARPEKLTAFEVGAKSEFWDRRLQLNGAVFFYDYKDQQFLDANYNATGALLYSTTNAPKSRVVGGELELKVKATDDLEIRSSIGALSTKYVELTLGGVDLSGKHLVLAPKLSLSAGIDWRVAQAFGGDLRFQLDGNYYSKQYFDAPNTERFSQAGYAVANARLALVTGAAPQYTVAAWIKNLAKREYLTYGLVGPGLDYTIVGEPRLFGLEAAVKF